MPTNFLIAPVLLHLFTAIILLFFSRNILLQKIVSSLACLASVVIAFLLFSKVQTHEYLTLQLSNWQAPYGITFVADYLSAIMVCLTSLVAFSVSVYSSSAINWSRIRFGYFSIFHFLIMGLMGAFLTGDIFNLYVWFEVVIISSFILLTVGGKKMQMEGAIKYVSINMFASVIFLTAIGILYGITGTLNIADLSLKVSEIKNNDLVHLTSLLFFVAFGIKSAVFPLYFWLPSSYHTPPSAIAAVFGALLTKLGIYTLLRVFTIVFTPDAFTLIIFSIIASMTLLTGVFGAMNKRNIRRMFSYLIVCHIGYLIAGIGIYTPLALAGIIFYLIHDVIVKCNLFLITGVIYKIRNTVDMQRLGGLSTDYPKFSILVFIALFSLVGLPPLSGFWPKILLFKEAYFTNDYVLLAMLLLASFVTLFLIARFWSEVFWKESPKPLSEVTDRFSLMSFSGKFALVFPVFFLCVCSLYIAFNANYLLEISQKIGTSLLDKNQYIQAVLKLK